MFLELPELLNPNKKQNISHKNSRILRNRYSCNKSQYIPKENGLDIILNNFELNINFLTILKINCIKLQYNIHQKKQI